MNSIYHDPSPCQYCTRVANPEGCENKRCNYWKKWFLRRWSLIHDYPRRQQESAAPCRGLATCCAHRAREERGEAVQ